LRERFIAYLQNDLFVEDCYVGADPAYWVPVRVITELAWHSLFARNMFIRTDSGGRQDALQPGFTVIDAPGFTANPDVDGTRSEVFVVIHFGRREVLIGGTPYAGEMQRRPR
jgi:phosphoenolpyruvate carboxykinase (ATP)